MIIYLTTPDGRHTIDEYLAGTGAPLRDVLTPWTYPELLARAPSGLPAGTYVFADIERLDAATEARVLPIWEGLQRDPTRWRTLNRPGRTMRRLALLEALYAAGINDFRVFPAHRELPADTRFPVFVRVADDHDGPRSGLVSDRAALAVELAKLRAAGVDLAGWLVCEYAGAQRGDASYVKYGAFVVDGVIVPRHVMYGSGWVVKESDLPVSAASHHEAWLFNVSKTQPEPLARAFAIAGIDFGRADYILLPDGRIRVWEINTNPHWCSLAAAADVGRRALHQIYLRRMEETLRALDRRVASAPAVPSWKERVRWRALRSSQPFFGISFLERELWVLERRAYRFASGLLSGAQSRTRGKLR